MEHLYNLLYRPYNTWWTRHAKKRAAHNPRWQEIQQIREQATAQHPGLTAVTSLKHGLTIDMYFEQRNIERAITAHTVLHRIHWWFNQHPLAAHPATWLRNTVHRARKGWTNTDIANLDTALASYIVETVSRLRDTAAGHPTTLTEQTWNHTLTEIVNGFQLYLDHDGDIPDEHHPTYQNAWTQLQTWHPHLWN